jgi:hypothetical protein
MKKSCSVFAMFLLISLPVLLRAGEIDVSGDWEMTTESPRGEMTRTIHIEQEGENITVTMPGRGGGEVKGKGTIKGDKIEWTITRSTQRGEFTMTYTGTVEGDTMSGEVGMGERGSMPWKAKRKQ